VLQPVELVKSLHPVVHADELESSFPTDRLSGIPTQGLHRSIQSFVVEGASLSYMVEEGPLYTVKIDNE
jgi:hypothetical protein